MVVDVDKLDEGANDNEEEDDEVDNDDVCLFGSRIREGTIGITDVVVEDKKKFPTEGTADEGLTEDTTGIYGVVIGLGGTIG